MSENRTGDLTRAQYYDRIRSQIEHEDELINFRVVWQLLAQSFFFSTYASLLNVEQPKSVLFHQEQEVLFWLVPVAALFAGLLTAVSIFTSLANIAHLRHLFEDYAKDEAAKDQSAKLFPPIQGVLFSTL